MIDPFNVKIPENQIPERLKERELMKDKKNIFPEISGKISALFTQRSSIT
jgi:hypothetical protein